MISNILQILDLQPQKFHSITRTILSHTRSKQFDNKIPFLGNFQLFSILLTLFFKFHSLEICYIVLNVLTTSTINNKNLFQSDDIIFFTVSTKDFLDFRFMIRCSVLRKAFVNFLLAPSKLQPFPCLFPSHLLFRHVIHFS